MRAGPPQHSDLGGTGSGKTTLLNVLSSFIPEGESIITIENPAELQLQHPDVRRLEARPPNIEGKGEVTQRELVQDALRMFPDRIIVGEVRGGEAFDMLQAMNSGHLGSMTTGHANDAQGMARRLVSMVQMAEDIDMPYSVAVDLVANGIDLIVHIVREKTGRRRIDHVVEVVGPVRGPDGASYDVELNPLWKYVQGKGFVWVAEEMRADHLERLRDKGGWRPPAGLRPLRPGGEVA
ncbi:CpaF family protein [Ammonifex degensii]|uniref:CpaF family protein n=1 Tax=Ammonifex degensii TaxID=42838 RepID=UPI0006742EB2|nr:CpaF/VirB11 family protein [Ammonifex degensii]